MKAARRRAGRHSVRLRLTLLYVGLFLASAAGLLTITYFLVEQQLPQVTTSGGMIAITGGGSGGGLGAGVSGSCTSSQGSLPAGPSRSARASPSSRRWR